MPTLLDGSLYFDPTIGLIVKDGANKFQDNELSHAISVAHEFLSDCPECVECLCGGSGPFNENCNCNLPLPKILILLNEFRLDPNGKKKWKLRMRNNRIKYEEEKKIRIKKKMIDRAEKRNLFGSSCCTFWKRDENGVYGCRKY